MHAPVAFLAPAVSPFAHLSPLRHFATPGHLCPTMASSTPPPSTTSAAAPTLYAARLTDRADAAALRANTRDDHLKWATSDAVHMEFGGPLRTSSDAPPHGSLIIMRAESPAAAAELLCTDPYGAADLFAHADVRRWVRATPSPLSSPSPLPDQLFMVWCVDRADCKALRKNVRPRHLDWWHAAGRQGMIGPFPDTNMDGAVGSLIVCEGQSVQEVTAWADTDPYKIAGLFESVTVAQVNKVIEHAALAQ